MISGIEWVRSAGCDPYANLALEKCLTLGVPEGRCVLFLWQNRDTVVIGRNQNAWEECVVRRFREGRGNLARRLSGGGAVYHDLGNLNFSFLARKAAYDPKRQGEVILRAVRRLGVPAERTGRNDFEAGGRKFSGNAYYEHRGFCCHHGTLMMDVDLDRMERVLTPSRAKLRSRGVASVRSRVVNLREFVPGLDRETLEEALLEAFGAVYGLRPEALPPEERPGEALLGEERARMASEEWILGRQIPFTSAMEDRFPWGGLRIELAVDRGRITEAVCWSDAMDGEWIRRTGEGLKGCPYDGEAMARRVLEAGGEAPEERRRALDIARMIREGTDEAAPGP